MTRQERQEEFIRKILPDFVVIHIKKPRWINCYAVKAHRFITDWNLAYHDSKADAIDQAAKRLGWTQDHE